MRPSAAAVSIPAASSPVARGHPAAPRRFEPFASRVERHPPGQEPGSHAGVDRSMHVAAPQRGEEAHVAVEIAQRASAAGRDRGRVGERGREHHDHRTGPVAARPRDRAERVGRECFARHRAHDRGRVRRERVRDRREVDERYAQLHGRAANAQVDDGQRVFQVGAEDHNRGGAVAVGDLRAREPEHQLGGQAVADLRVDVVGADHTLHQSRDRVRVLVGATRAADQRDRFGAVLLDRLAQDAGRRVERLRPRHLAELAVDAAVRFEHAVVGVDPLDAVAALVAQPAVVDRLGVDTEQAHEAVRRRLQRAPALHRARVARGLDGLEVPRPGLEPVLARGERAHRADLHGVAREVRVERLPGEVEHLHAVAAVDEVDQRVARDLVGEARAPAALDAALAVEQHELAEPDRLLEVPLLLDEARLAGTERERLVLQRALAAAVAHRAVERMVHEQELEDAVLDLLHRVGLCAADHSLGDRRGARGRESTHTVDLDEAHAAHADRLHPLVPAETRDVDAVLLRGLDQQLAGLGLEGDVVDRDGDGVLHHFFLGLGGGHAPTSAA